MKSGAVRSPVEISPFRSESLADTPRTPFFAKRSAEGVLKSNSLVEHPVGYGCCGDNGCPRQNAFHSLYYHRNPWKGCWRQADGEEPDRSGRQFDEPGFSVVGAPRAMDQADSSLRDFVSTSPAPFSPVRNSSCVIGLENMG